MRFVFEKNVRRFHTKIRILEDIQWYSSGATEMKLRDEKLAKSLYKVDSVDFYIVAKDSKYPEVPLLKDVSTSSHVWKSF